MESENNWGYKQNIIRCLNAWLMVPLCMFVFGTIGWYVFTYAGVLSGFCIIGPIAGIASGLLPIHQPPFLCAGFIYGYYLAILNDGQLPIGSYNAPNLSRLIAGILCAGLCTGVVQIAHGTIRKNDNLRPLKISKSFRNCACFFFWILLVTCDLYLVNQYNGRVVNPEQAIIETMRAGGRVR